MKDFNQLLLVLFLAFTCLFAAGAFELALQNHWVFAGLFFALAIFTLWVVIVSLP